VAVYDSASAAHPKFSDLEIMLDFLEGQEGSREISGSRKGHSCQLRSHSAGARGTAGCRMPSTSSSLISSVGGGLSEQEKC
jgi:hypothetical protein